MAVNNETRRIDPSTVRIRTTIVEEGGRGGGCLAEAALVVTVNNKKRIKTIMSGWNEDAMRVG